jgi:hypothetical protein
MSTRCFLVGERAAGAESDEVMGVLKIDGSMVDLLDLEAGERG